MLSPARMLSPGKVFSPGKMLKELNRSGPGFIRALTEIPGAIGYIKE
ncbi:hypothetical protein RB2501_06380 [Robiginitalea biformata HTCC2501]|uniref:Uncharacterized protein n=1 Tax=Robiginitalea biformata (strain ATCC BAA-864 / DSM 15991 / KCTC 12146 / HTCC2501) TaxID=313596 RepID=A4CHU6_ROBBH|nr:hypothetical protein RB2501_06380 [Robiginitalea biformata HTCC2501]